MSLNKREYVISDLVIDDEYGTISANATVEKAAQEMKKLGVPDLVVLEDGTEKVIGVIGDFDIVKNVVAEKKDPTTMTTKEAMFVIPPVTLKTPVEEAFVLMQKLNANVVPVVENEKLVGVASTYDVWNYIPEETTDEIGLISIKNPKNGEFWFATACSLMAFMFLIIFPISGIIGFFKADAIDMAFLMKIGDRTLLNGEFRFSLFEVFSFDDTFSIFDVAKEIGFWGYILAIFAILFVIVGLMGIFSIIYASYSDLQNLRTGNLVRILFPSLLIGFEILIWLLYLIALNAADITFRLDGTGFILQLLGLLFIVMAVFRDYLFREEAGATVKPTEAQ